MDLQWYYSFGWFEYSFIFLFVLAYGLYLRRMWVLSGLFKVYRRWLFIKLPLRIVYFSLLLIALVGPSFGYGKKFIQAVGKEIFILIDLSKSMDANDIQPSRLEKVKYEVKNLIQTFENDRIGIIVFSTEAFLQCPLTYDKGALELFLQNINTLTMPTGGTDFYSPLNLALKKMKAEQNKITDFKAKLVLLISDGEDFGDKTNEILSEYQKQGIRVFTLGVGTPQGSRIPMQDRFKYDKQGLPVVTRLNYAILNQIAEKTGGQFFEINREKNDISQLIKTIQNIKGQRLDIRTTDVSFNKYEYFLWVALALICLDIIFIIKVIKL
jgi:Ca-activated chloride channel family protein